MSFDIDDFNQALESYLEDCVSLEFERSNIDNPIAGGSLGPNIDVGEIRSFNIRVTNSGPLGMLNVQIRVTSFHGQLSQSYSGFTSLAGSHWLGPFQTPIVVRAFNLGPNDTYVHDGSQGRYLFGYNAQSTTGGSDNDRDIETLLIARIEDWQPDFRNVELTAGEGPKFTYDNFVQRS